MEIFNIRHVNCSYSTKVVYNDSAHLTSKYIFTGFCCGYKDSDPIRKVLGI